VKAAATFVFRAKMEGTRWLELSLAISAVPENFSTPPTAHALIVR